MAAVSEDFPYLTLGVELNLALARALQGDVRAYEEAVSKLDSFRDLDIADIDYARPIEALALMQERVGAKDAARELLQTARLLYTRLGLNADVARIENLLG